MQINTDQDLINEFLDRGIENIYPKRDFVEARLKEGKQLSMYVGIDPTADSMHVGHSIFLRKMRQFQNLGHKIILLIGDFTGMIGDPTDKSATRVRLTREQVLENAKTYKEQAARIISFEGENAAEIKFNSQWLAKMSFEDVVDLSSHFTVQQMLERDMFHQRLAHVVCHKCGQNISLKQIGIYGSDDISKLADNFRMVGFRCPSCQNDQEFTKDDIVTKPIYMHEFLYPLMQGYDTVAMDVDGELGGNDQTFNMLAGRTLMKAMKNKEKFVLTTKLLVDPTGKKMGKSEGNMIRFSDSSDEIFGKVMSWPDGMIAGGFELLTDLDMDEVATISKSLIREEANPRDVKARLAREVVVRFYDQVEAQAASDRFDQLFKEHEVPEDVPELQVNGSTSIVDVLIESKLASSKSDVRRLIDGGGVKVNGEVVEDAEFIVEPTSEGILIQKGKRHFVRVISK